MTLIVETIGFTSTLISCLDQAQHKLLFRGIVSIKKGHITKTVLFCGEYRIYFDFDLVPRSSSA